MQYSIVTKFFINVMWDCSKVNKLIKKKRIMDRCLNMSVWLKTIPQNQNVFNKIEANSKERFLPNTRYQH